MTEEPRAKSGIKERLSYAQRLALRRLLVGAVRLPIAIAATCYNATQGLIRRAVAHGLDLNRSWDVDAPQITSLIPPFGIKDLFYLKDVLGTGEPPADEREIRTSIIIPVFDHADLTFQCLRSLIAEVDAKTTEIIVVNDASTDETGKLLDLFSGHVRVVTNERNLGFGETCNAGAAIARGRYLVFLNNDTWVLPGWLTELEATIDSRPDVGAAGSMFIYPDGRVQEAGAIIWRNGAAHHYGWHRSPDDSRLNFAREVDYCSAASLLIRKEIFDKLGGFDKRYSPAYYEDADLCMGVRSLNAKVVYQPASRLLHYEGGTAGTDVRTGLKQHQITNRSVFVDKWRETLERDHVEEDVRNVWTASDRRESSVIVIDDRVPTPDRDAGSARMMHILRTLAVEHRVVFAPLSVERWPEYERELLRIGVEFTTGSEYLRLMSDRRFDAAIVSRPDVAEAVIPVLKRRFRGLKVIFDMVDVHFIRLEREFKTTGDPETLRLAQHYRDLEPRLVKMADAIWCNSSEDQRIVAALVPAKPSIVIPTIHTLARESRSFEEREGLLFVGNMLHRPNVDSLAFLLDEIMPRVGRELPNVTLSVVGSHIGEELRARGAENIRIVGHVPDLKPVLMDARLMLAPLRFGAGVKGKIGESVAHGLPVVTTPTGAESIGIINEESAMIAETPDDLAAATVRAYNDRELWQRLSQNGRKLVEQHFTPDVVSELINGSVRTQHVQKG